jgi:oligopeptide transport system substrate-binding protein
MMKLQKTNEHRNLLHSFCVFVFFGLIVFSTSCSEIKSPTPEPFIGENAPPPKQEFRWTNGKLPKSFDPARAAASPESDVVRALYDGLVEVDSKNNKPTPAIAEKWSSSEDKKVWTFELRQNAKWSNGEQITAEDFVRSWRRLTELGNKVQQRNLLKNIVGMDTEDALPVFADEVSQELIEAEENTNNSLWNQKLQLEENTQTPSPTPNKSPADVKATPSPTVLPKQTPKKIPVKPKMENKFGVEAVGKFVLKVSLVFPDPEFPLLVAHPIFRPVYGDGKEFENNELSTNIVTNGAFRLQTIAKDGITLERSENYWNKDSVKLEVVKFVPTENAEQALAAYREGKVDVVTNVNFQPLALKLLKPFHNEFHQTIHGALNFYEFNLNEKPFNDVKVREALAISIDRESLTDDLMDGASAPALNFLPFDEGKKKLKPDVEQAQKLLSEAGYEDGENFPTIKLVVNRNSLQQRIARSVAKMWQKNLNVNTEIIVRDFAEVENSIQTGDYSVARRGLVLPTNNETSNMLAMFDGKRILTVKEEKKEETPKATPTPAENEILTDKTAESEINLTEPEKTPEKIETDNLQNHEIIESEIILTEEQALNELPAIPLYFPTSYSLVKPYIQGFELNSFDATSLKNVQIDSNWQPSNTQTTSK